MINEILWEKGPMKNKILLREVLMKPKFAVLSVALLCLVGAMVSSAGADSGFLKALSLTAAKTGGLDVDFTVTETTLTSTTSPFTTTAFSGTLDFGDGDTTLGFTVDVVKSKKRGSKGFTNTLEGVVSHTYPAPGQYTATLTNCCEAYLYDGYPTSVYPTITLTDTTTFTVGADNGGGECAEQTLFAQINCLLDALRTDVIDAGLGGDLTGKLQQKIDRAQLRKEDAEVACLAEDESTANTKMGKAREKMNNFIGVVNNKKGKDIPVGLADDLIAKAEAILDLIEGLLTSACDGADCLPDPPLGAINCELDQLIAKVAGGGLDPALTDKLLSKLTASKEKKEKAEEKCLEGNEKKAAKNLNGALRKCNGFQKKLNKKADKGEIPQDFADECSLRADTIKGLMEGLLQSGVCGGI